MKDYRFQVEYQKTGFTVTRLRKYGNRYYSDPTVKPKFVTNLEMYVYDLSALFEYDDIKKGH